jgi:threonine dehydratase
MSAIQIPSLIELQESLLRIESFVHKTPVLSSQLINEIAGAELFFKCENFQKVGAFKFRGAINAILQLTEEERAKGVATHSSGNHAQALALAAKMNNTKAYIVMPTSAPKVKSAAVADYGAEIIWCEPNLKARESTLVEVVNDTGATIIHPYDNHQVICGQSTAAQELLEAYDNLDVVITPVGGGGLLSGTALAVKYQYPDIKVIAAEPEGANDAYQSFKGGKLVPSVDPNTIADGLLTSLSERTFNIIGKYVDDIFTASDEEILAAMHLIWERMKIIIEPSSAVALAIVLKNQEYFIGKRIAIIFSGGNVDLKKFSF